MKKRKEPFNTSLWEMPVGNAEGPSAKSIVELLYDCDFYSLELFGRPRPRQANGPKSRLGGLLRSMFDPIPGEGGGKWIMQKTQKDMQAEGLPICAF